MDIDFSKYPDKIQFTPWNIIPFEIKVSYIIDLRDSILTIRKNIIGTSKINIKKYDIDDSNMEKLLEFISIEEMERFNALTSEELSNSYTGYRDEGYYIKYRVFCDGNNLSVTEGELRDIYKNNPLEKAVMWIHKTFPRLKKF